MSLHIAIVGYGTAGQTAAVVLSRQGHRVEVFERAPAPGPVGAGFLLQPTGLRVLWRMGLLDEALRYGAPIARLFGETERARPVMDMRYRELDARLFGLGMQRGALFEILDAAWTQERCLHAGSAIAGIDSERGELREEGGRRHGPFDLVLLASGAATALRAAVDTPVLDRPYPWGARWCLVEQGAWPWPGELRQRYRHARKMAGMLPVGTRPGDPVPRLSFFWSLPACDLDHANPERVAGSEVAEVQALWPDAWERLCTVPWPGGLAGARYRDCVMARWHRGRVIAIGDAAHAMSPQLGQGANMALLDAFTLGEALQAGRDTVAAVSEYVRQRRRHLAAYHFWSRWLTPLFQSEHDGLAGLRDRLMHPLSRLPGGRGQMLRVLTGTRRGVFGTFPLERGFLDALGERALATAVTQPA